MLKVIIGPPTHRRLARKPGLYRGSGHGRHGSHAALVLPWTRLPHLLGSQRSTQEGECYTPGTLIPTASFWPGLCHLVHLGRLR